ncbi:MAG: hypothetical protein IPK68_01830 [Bdellovibrionales bacterium]|nr:hypothetical protein [Bdellovibrionales bacterium]
MFQRSVEFVLFSFLSLALSQLSVADEKNIHSSKGACSDLLRAEQLQILQVVDKTNGHYKVAVFSGEVDGKRRAVVFLGETHIKDKANSVLGKQVIEKFDAYGIERPDTSKTWGGKALDVSLDVVQMAIKVFSFGKLSEGSTTGDAEDRDFTRNLLEELKKFAEDNRLASLSMSEADEFQVKMGDITIPGSKLLQFIEILAGEAKNGPLVFNLEEGHQPNLAENIVSVIIPGAVAACLYGIGLTVCEIGSSLASGGGIHGALETLGALVGGLALAEGMKRILGKYDVVALVARYPYEVSLGRGRNQTMTNNVFKAFEKNPSLDTLLVIVGSNHISGMGHQLNQQRGFLEIPLDQIGAREPLNP